VLDTVAFVDLLVGRVPETSATVVSHLDENDGEIDPYSLIGRVVDLGRGWLDEDQPEPLRRLLEVMELGLATGDDLVEDIVRSFVEHAACETASSERFVASWPSALQQEAELQRIGSERAYGHHVRRLATQRKSAQARRVALIAQVLSLAALATFALLRMFLADGRAVWSAGTVMTAALSTALLLVRELLLPGKRRT
jgi:hypothetical protein